MKALWNTLRMANKGVAGERVSLAFGVSSIVAAVASLLVPAAVVRIWLSIATTGNSDTRWSGVVAVANFFGLGIAWAIAAAAIILGVTSIRRAKRHTGQPGSANATALGWVGIAIAAALSYFYFLGLGI